MTKKYYYKAMNKDMKCRDFQFKVGEIYTIDSKELELCLDKIFYFCERLEDTTDYYNNPTDRHFLIDVLGDIVTEDNLSGSNKIRIVKEINRDKIYEYIQDKDSLNAKRFLALYSTNINILEELSKEESKYVRRALAGNLNIPVYLLEELAKDKEWDVCLVVAQNPNTPVHILEELSKDEICYVREEVAFNKNTPVSILEQFVKSEIWIVRKAVAENINTPVYLLEELAKDKYWVVRKEVARNENTPIDILENLSKDKDWTVRKYVLLNLNTPAHILEKLAKDKYTDIRINAKERLKEITQ